MKVLIFGQYYEPSFKAGGPVRSLKNIVELISELRWEHQVITSFVDLDGIDNGGFESDGVVKWKTIDVLRSIYKSDLIIINSVFSPKYSIVPLFISIALSKKILLIPRGEFFEAALKSGRSRLKRIYVFYLGLIKKIFFVGATSNAEYESLEQSGFRVKYIPNLRFDLLAQRPLDKRLTNKKVYGILGRVSFLKNQVLVYKAWTRKLGTLIVQGPQDEGILLESDPERNIEIIDGSRDTSLFFSRIDVLIVPSLSENYCHSAHEGGACGKVLLISDSLRIGLSSFTFKNDEELALRNSIEMIKSMKDKDFEKLKEETRIQTLQKLSDDIIIAKDAIKSLFS